MIRVNNIQANLNVDLAGLKEIVSIKTGLDPEYIKSVKIAKKSVDARNKGNVHFVYSLDMEVWGDEDYIATILAWKDIELIKERPVLVIRKQQPGNIRPLVVGSGPAGMFAGLALAEAGLKPVIIERGKPVDERQKDVSLFWRTGKLKPDSNVQFGEGGAGTFSDGKLMTGIKKDKYSAAGAGGCRSSGGDSLFGQTAYRNGQAGDRGAKYSEKNYCARRGISFRRMFMRVGS